MSFIEILGWIAPIIFSIVFVPQAIKVILSKHTKGLSAISYTVIYMGSTLYMLWGGIANEPLPQLFISEFIVSAIELIIIFYIFKNLKKTWFFYVLAFWGLTVAAIALSGWISPSLGLGAVGIAPISIIGGLSIAFAFMPQTINAIVKRDVKNISIMTVSALAIATSLLGTYQLFHSDNHPLKPISQFEKIMGGTVEFFAAAWCIPQIVLKVIDNKRIKKAHKNDVVEIALIKQWANDETHNLYKRARLYEWMSTTSVITKEKLDKVAEELDMNHKDLDEAMDSVNKYLKNTK